MARRKTLPTSLQTKHALAERLSQIRREMFGERGGPELARQLGIPVRTWYNYEGGVTVPAEVILRIIELTSIEPMWLLHGKEPKFRSHSEESSAQPVVPKRSAGSLLRAALEILEQDERTRKLVFKSPDGKNGTHTEKPHGEVKFVGAEDAEREVLFPPLGDRYLGARGELQDAQRDEYCIRNTGNAMEPVVEDGAYVAFSRKEEAPAALDAKMVVAWVNGEPLVRWFQHCDRYGLLRAENPETDPPHILIDLEGEPDARRVRRVLWIVTPH